MVEEKNIVKISVRDVCAGDSKYLMFFLGGEKAHTQYIIPRCEIVNLFHGDDAAILSFAYKVIGEDNNLFVTALVNDQETLEQISNKLVNKVDSNVRRLVRKYDNPSRALSQEEISSLFEKAYLEGCLHSSLSSVSLADVVRDTDSLLRDHIHSEGESAGFTKSRDLVDQLSRRRGK